ncbi:hypothetical protein POJ06DRAFT_190391 [Lipomyces tetrasporus]|uniref:Methyltransferase n=1 Tax=Lipomyces tetrasporus TaxID=54092 RepID=A0AAD7QZ84_9ASCO|nr:uncharacterized protein POJ06DRAFT_190391 [Lipomyces tetrasporus]KAJ8104143.1 hypothetical protein POJ06DRAFT_190391 [Lipomyces tetrasporus]
MATITETLPARAAVESTLNFYAPPKDGSVPYNIVYDVPEGTPTRNYEVLHQKVQIIDARGREGDFTLDNNGFQFEKRHHAFNNWSDAERIEKEYYPGVINAIKEVTGASKVVIFDNTIRTKDGYRKPVMAVHVDQTPKSAEDRVRLHCPDEADVLLARRFQIINYWKPLTGPVEEFPLALGDAGDMSEGDIVSVEHRYRDRTGATGAVQYNPNQKYYYLSGMDTDEEVLIKCYDSLDGVAKRTPHTAFEDPTSAPNALPRESIEVRTLVFYD